jgi:hypothetical protein
MSETRELRLNEWRGSLSFEERLAKLETKVFEEDERLYNIVLPEIDEQINRAIRQSNETHNRAVEQCNETTMEVRTAKQELEKSIQDALTKTVNELIASSNADVVVNALREALKSTVLITRQANRGELANVGVLVTRPATQAELRNS